MKRGSITAADVHQTPARHMLAGGYDIVLGLEKGRSRRLWDAQRRRSIRPVAADVASPRNPRRAPR
jgi:hypothetical protein